MLPAMPERGGLNPMRLPERGAGKGETECGGNGPASECAERGVPLWKPSGFSVLPRTALACVGWTRSSSQRAARHARRDAALSLTATAAVVTFRPDCAERGLGL